MATSKNLSVKPLGDRVVVKPLARDEVSASGIIIPDTATQEKSERGTVVAVGSGRYEDGAVVPMNVKVGDEVLFQHVYQDPVKIDGEEYYIFSESNILAIIKQ